MALRIERLSEALGAEVSGIDLRGELDEATREQIRQAMLDHQFLVVRGQGLGDFEHMRFCRTFGALQAERTVPDSQSDEIVGMMFVSNFHEEGILPNGEMWFHSDQCYFDTPCKMTSLYAVEVPASGGYTRFANCITAYDTLDADIKARIDGVVGMNIYDYDSPNMHMKSAERTAGAPQFAHPIVRTHPETGRNTKSR